MSKFKYTLGLDEVLLSDIDKVGGKNASLGEMIQNLSPLGVKVPGGYAVTVDGYWKYLDYNNMRERVKEAMEGLDTEDVVQLRQVGSQVRNIVRDGTFPEDMITEIRERYLKMSAEYGNEITDVAVRSSATAEDLPDASFAGQQETYLNVRGSESILNSVRDCFASLFTDRAISYRENFGYDHFNIGLSVTIQKMVRSDLGSSGVAFSLDTESGFKDVVLINGSYGLVEMVVVGAVKPDEFLVFKPTLAKGFRPIVEKKLGNKDHKMIYGNKPGQRVQIVSLPKKLQSEFCIDDDKILQIGDWVSKIEKYYSDLKGQWTPMDVEWAVDGLTNELFIVQARPETIHSQKIHDLHIEYKIEKADRENDIILRGIAVGDKIASGKVKILYSMDGRDGSADMSDFKEGDVLVTEMTDPDWEPLMKKASAIVTDKGGRTCHAAIIARELGVPAIVGAGNATEILNEEQLVTVSCAEGSDGIVYNGEVEFETIETDLNSLPKTDTPIMMNVASPELAYKFSHIPNEGVGLARQEFVINNYIQVHPLALMQHKELEDETLTAAINKITEGYESEEEFFISKLAQGVGKIASAFYPKRTIVRLSDFKSNEYFNMLGGRYFEPDEENPMIGFRGASRYYSESYKPAFAWEIKALKRAREEFGLDNITIMVPFCRTVEELEKVYEVMEENGLKRGENGLEIYIMAELPSNIMMAQEFSELVDGFSIGSNDLTQLTLGLDRDSSLVAHIYDERNPAVKRMISHLIRTAKETGTKVGICGQGPSDFPDFAQFLVEEGINTISVTPDSVMKTIKAVHTIENK